MTTLEQQKGEDLIKTLIEKAWANPEFKKQLVNNPAETIGSIVGKDLGATMPNGKKLVVVDQTDDSTFYLNIPSQPQIDVELKEEELEQVSGGAGGPLYDAGVWVGHQIKDFYNWATS
ncbi:NHLP leader peptide family RiPP precursor [Chryseobacterium sp. MEBOG06]|uniref:NHLP leader peptide family RiPP precursor n=1 Tax=Chryseobacterium sp. MEBOG06 TaxID=2879938 RepID=UPI001F2E82E8|nr:NHLP leader peptide family RiPP precursor [Chryseobacterium sp. MEBOG06]UKB83913.1 NHLP leader peptide family RiPP precursor [Chryseobacterium sp. MEBOG06]